MRSTLCFICLQASGHAEKFLLVFHQEGEQVGHRGGPHFAQRVVVETLVQPNHVLNVCRRDKLERVIAIRRQRRRTTDGG